MKRISIILISAALFCAAAPARAQFSWGVESGANFSKAHVKDDHGLYSSASERGWFVGPKVQYMFPQINIGIDGAVLYSQKHLKMEAEGRTMSAKSLPYVEVPINARYHYNFNVLIGLYVATGPELDWYVGSRNVKLDNESYGRLERSSFSWNVSFGVILMSHLQVGFNYNIALDRNGRMDDFDFYERFDLKNNTFQFRCAFLY